jgi:hypothetical protein
MVTNAIKKLGGHRGPIIPRVSREDSRSPPDRSPELTEGADFRYWHVAALIRRAERVRSARVHQTSTCSAMASASSTSMPR